MSAFLLKRCAGLIATLLAVSLVVFTVMQLLPGNAAQVMLGPEAPAETVAALTHQLGFDRPAPERYLGWILGMVRGDFGMSYVYRTPVAELLRGALSVTLPLAAMAMALNVLVGLGLGIYAASRHNRLADLLAMSLSQLGIAIPSFWLAILLVLLFAVKLGWLPAGGFPGWNQGLSAGLRSLLLPTVALAGAQAAILARVTRGAVLDVLNEDFVRTARAKGLSERATLWRHVLRNALIPIVTIMGLQFSGLLVLTIAVESVFYLPGLGRLVLNAVANRDFVVVEDVVMLLSAAVVAVNFLVDLLYVAIDPRLRLGDL
jgi:peptide/nickel transport system permease protein